MAWSTTFALTMPTTAPTAAPPLEPCEWPSRSCRCEPLPFNVPQGDLGSRERLSAPQADELLPFTEVHSVASGDDVQLLPRSEYEHRNTVRAQTRDAALSSICPC